ncbi:MULTISPECIES: DUF1799 domain-containing protein [Rhodovulum]|uniref:DUF1799 domain-containing protein n=2 Tax=Rhodovulum TaxID=34008 RepID=A0A844B8L9_9RHOB|nr:MULTISPECIES: DUF1799 domain-containing protein [Rhodovulum]MRH22651.1 hypothetical protein [Rhodovulum strictum]TCM84779.1 uncharacterized protein DUF1799 [Rhodovulum steppense]
MGVDLAETGIETEEDEFEVWQSNWDSVVAFLACETQWRLAAGLAGAVWLGLDYGAVDIVLRHHHLPSGVFVDIQFMERAAMAVLNGARDG